MPGQHPDAAHVMRASITRKLAAAGVAAAGAVGLVSTFGGTSQAQPSINLPPGVGIGTINLPVLVGNQLQAHKNTTALGALGLINSTLGSTVFAKVQGTLSCSKLEGSIQIFPVLTKCP
jgi:hypothetical protein